MAVTPELQVSELFYSLQGESSFSGYPCVFIRLSGCNLNCAYCDSRYAVDDPGSPCSIDEIKEYVDRYPGDLVEITGGEPLYQEAVYQLMDRLVLDGRIILLETNGSISLSRIPAGVVKIMDIKCPDSGMHDRMEPGNLQLLTPVDEVKFVISSTADYEWARDFVDEHKLHFKTKVTFSPNVDSMKAVDLGTLILKDRLPVRLQLQLHTILWPDRDRGV